MLALALRENSGHSEPTPSGRPSLPRTVVRGSTDREPRRLYLQPVRSPRRSHVSSAWQRFALQAETHEGSAPRQQASRPRPPTMAAARTRYAARCSELSLVEIGEQVEQLPPEEAHVTSVVPLRQRQR